MKEKKCSGCGDTKKFNQFNENKAAHDGKNSLCKACTKINNDKFKAKNKKKESKLAKERAALRREDSPEVIDEKLCKVCIEVKALGEFDFNNSSKCGRTSVCKICRHKIRSRKARTPEQIKQAKKIMSVPVNFRKTQHFYMGKRPGFPTVLAGVR